METGHAASLALGLTLFLIPFPQILRAFAEKLNWFESDAALKALALAAGVSACVMAATFRVEALSGLVFLGLAIVAALVLAQKRSGAAFRLGFFAAMSPYFCREAFTDRESAFWLARSLRLFSAMALAYLLISGVESQGGEASLRVFFIVVIAASALSALAGPLLCSGGLVWWFFGEGAGLDVRMAAALSASGAGFLVLGALGDSLLSAAWLSRMKAKEENPVDFASASD